MTDMIDEKGGENTHNVVGIIFNILRYSYTSDVSFWKLKKTKQMIMPTRQKVIGFKLPSPGTLTRKWRATMKVAFIFPFSATKMNVHG